MAFIFMPACLYRRYCEDQLLQVAVACGLCKPPTARLPLESLLRSHLDKARSSRTGRICFGGAWWDVAGCSSPPGPASQQHQNQSEPVITSQAASRPLQLTLGPAADASEAARVLLRFLTRREARLREVLWQLDDPADTLFIIEQGAVRVDAYQLQATGLEDSAPGAPAPGAGGSPGGRVRVRSFELGPGCVSGATDFVLGRPHGTRALCCSPSCQLLCLSRDALARLAAEAPAALSVLQLVILRANTIDLVFAAEQGTAAA